MSSEINSKMKNFKRFAYIIGALVPFIALAEDMPEYDLTIQNIFAIINGLVCWAARMSYLLMIVMLVYSGVMFFLSNGEPAKVTKAREGLKWVAIGIAVVLATYTIIATVANAVGVPDVSRFLPLHC